MQRNLETHRFNIKEQSIGHMEAMRELFEVLQKEIPEICGIAFFGSRTVGQEKDYEINDAFDGVYTDFPPDLQGLLVSDLDVIVFYDDSHVEENQRGSLRRNIGGRFVAKYQELGLPAKDKNGIPNCKLIEISQERTKNDLANFILATDNITKIGNGKYAPNARNSEVSWRLAARFFLAIGDKLYQNRRSILEQLSSMPEGDRYFKALMDNLLLIEREIKRSKYNIADYIHLPETVEEGEKYFLTRLPKITKKE